MTIGQARYIELVLGVEAAMVLRHILAQQAIGADHGLLSAHRWFGGVVDHHEMVADLVERVLVAARQQRRGIRNGGAVLVEHAVTQFLGALHIALALGKPYLERAEPPKPGREIRQTDRPYDAGWGGPRPSPSHRRLC